MSDRNGIDEFQAQLKKLVQNLPDRSTISALSAKRLQTLKLEVESAIHRLHTFSQEINPIRQPKVVFDPANPKVIGELIARTLLLQPAQPLRNIGSVTFYGSGVYAIYYGGSFHAYTPISKTENPIYVGKVDPKHIHAQTVEEQGIGLATRLDEHRKSVVAANSTLSIDDFTCRYLVVKSAWQETAENYLISLFRPIWNKQTKVCYGFGKHGDKAETRANRRSPWDTLHPGRKWATEGGNVPNEKSTEQIVQDIADHFSKHPPVKSIGDVRSDMA